MPGPGGRGEQGLCGSKPLSRAGTQAWAGRSRSTRPLRDISVQQPGSLPVASPAPRLPPDAPVLSPGHAPNTRAVCSLTDPADCPPPPPRAWLPAEPHPLPSTRQPPTGHPGAHSSPRPLPGVDRPAAVATRRDEVLWFYWGPRQTMPSGPAPLPRLETWGDTK